MHINVPPEKVYELGPHSSIATVRDIPDITFDLAEFEMSEVDIGYPKWMRWEYCG